ncbi:hypothetical protein [Limosilactobacillus gorillae]|jgi:hypothetical protein|nr:hypothetical protein [Limosilactobacillus gorillae]
MMKNEKMLAALNVYENQDTKAEMSQLAAESANAELDLLCQDLHD